MNSNSEDSFKASNLPWNETLELSKSDRFGGKFNAIPEQKLRIAMKKSNCENLLESALKSLEMTDPEWQIWNMLQKLPI